MTPERQQALVTLLIDDGHLTPSGARVLAATNPHPALVRAVVDNGDLTPAGARVLLWALDDGQ